MKRERRKAQDREQDQREQRGIVDAEHVAEQQRRRLRRRRGVEMQEQQPEAERERQHHADRDVALRELFAEQAHADAGEQREADEAGERREAEQHRARSRR